MSPNLVRVRFWTALLFYFSRFSAKVAWNSYSFTFKWNNCTKASVTSDFLKSMPKVVSKTKAVQKKSIHTWIQYLGKKRKNDACQNICASWKLNIVTVNHWEKGGKEEIERPRKWRKQLLNTTEMHCKTIFQMPQSQSLQRHNKTKYAHVVQACMQAKCLSSFPINSAVGREGKETL